MKTFDITTRLAASIDKKHVSQTSDGITIVEFILQDEAAKANELFDNWFTDRALYYGVDYYLSRCPGGNWLICFVNAGEALWFENKYQGDLGTGGAA
ncbi:hypothetical protein [Novosphingobium guangzhouense]|uniref:Uncharacterized protein n=1 Tax=Novosphingobium guangzhouense TaxID=1850347 RepID=A0A2K2G0S2_9SPHN|nr:hypothetical protein [Novosphingobium guangzhouense]PNU04594.1 hypothetical protein A8V01_19490 [Novosphingobium guangzhouense]